MLSAFLHFPHNRDNVVILLRPFLITSPLKNALILTGEAGRRGEIIDYFNLKMECGDIFDGQTNLNIKIGFGSLSKVKKEETYHLIEEIKNKAVSLFTLINS